MSTLQPRLCPRCIRPCHGAPMRSCAVSARCGCYRTVRLRSCALRHPHGATTIAVGRCERALEIMVGRFHRALQPCGVDDAPPRRSADRTLSIPAGVLYIGGKFDSNQPQFNTYSLFVEFFFTNNIDMQKSQHATCTVDMQKYHNTQHVQYCMHVDM